MGTLSRRAIAGAAVLTTLCVVGDVSEVGAQRRTAPTFAWEGSVPSGGTVEIKGVNGSIRAVAATGATARVTAERSARRNDPNEVEIAVVEHAGGVTICAVYPSSMLRRNECLPGDEGNISARRNDVTVEFTVEVPARADFVGRTTNGEVSAEDLNGRVEARSTNGDVRIDGGAMAFARTTNGSVIIRTDGEADARTTNGEIEAYMGALSGTGPLDFSTTNGSITLGLPDAPNLEIDAATTNGRISSDFPITVMGTIGRNRLAGTIGSGGREIRLRTTNGSIVLERGS